MSMVSKLLVFISSGLLAAGAPRCRCLYGQSCWPDQRAFSDLSEELSQPLIQPTPVAATCYPSFTTPSTANCAEVTEKYRDGRWRSDQPGAVQNVNWELYIHPNRTVDGCYMDLSLSQPCKQGSIPPVGVEARTPQDIQAAVNFARKHDLRLVVKNTGHDYLGRSSGRGAFLIWTHRMKERSFNASFVPAGSKKAESFEAATLGAGVQWWEAYDFVNQHGRVLVGGLSNGGSVGSSGGWLMGGGHSIISPAFGLGVDNLLQVTIVLANGRHVTANAYQHSDLFWAIRGGGGGTWGVVTSVTYKTHPTFPVAFAAIETNFSSSSIAEKAIAEFIRFHPALSDANVGGYGDLSVTSMRHFTISVNKSVEEVTTLYAPLVERVKNATGTDPSFASFPLGSYYEFIQLFFSPNLEGSQVGANVEIASRLLSKKMTLSNPGRVAKAIVALEGVGINSIAGGAVAHFDPDSTGLNPAWRNTIAQVYTGVGWAPGTSAQEIIRQRQSLRDKTDILNAISTDSASYLNEGSRYEKDFKKTYYGSHYPRLKAIKKLYDPSGLFIVSVGVGSDEWRADLQCRA